MLVLTRKSGERLHIGDDITLTIVRVAGDRVRIGIDAPRHCQIARPEAARPPEHEPLPGQMSLFESEGGAE